MPVLYNGEDVFTARELEHILAELPEEHRDLPIFYRDDDMHMPLRVVGHENGCFVVRQTFTNENGYSDNEGIPSILITG